MPTSASTLQEEASIDGFFNLAATETLALFEHLAFDFLEEFDGFDLDGAVIIHFECLLPVVQTPIQTLILANPNIRTC